MRVLGWLLLSFACGGVLVVVGLLLSRLFF
jgi:hypothetical protein